MKRTIQLGKETRVRLAPVREPEWRLSIAICRRYFPILHGWEIEPVLSYCAARRRGDPLSTDGCEFGKRSVALLPLSRQAYDYLTNIHTGNHYRAVRHYVCHELGHAAFFAVTGQEHNSGFGDAEEAMLDRYDREEKTVDELAYYLAQLGTVEARP